MGGYSNEKAGKIYKVLLIKHFACEHKPRNSIKPYKSNNITQYYIYMDMRREEIALNTFHDGDIKFY